MILWLFILLCTVVINECEQLPIGKHHYSMYRLNGTDRVQHEKPWMALREVDGFMNEDMVMLITSSSVKQFHYVRGRIIPSSRTWIKMMANVFVMIEDTFQTRFAMRHCRHIETAHFTTFECHNEPTYVLARKCTNDYYGGPGPCCKVDELFTYLIVDRPEIYSHTKYVLHCDDDSYFRVDQIMKFLASLESAGLSTVPIVLNANENSYEEHVFNYPGCHEIHTGGWYQPLVINRAMIERAKVAFTSYGVTNTCDNFGFTHDVALGAFLWLFRPYHVRFPGFVIDNHETDIGSVVTHAVKHGTVIDNCDNITNYDKDQQYDQKTLMGCGTIDRAMKGHTKDGIDYNGDKILNDMYDLWNHFKVNGQDAWWGIHALPSYLYYNVTLYPSGHLVPGISTTGDERKVKIKYILTDRDVIDSEGKFQGDIVVEKYLPMPMLMDGYETTEHSKKYNIMKEWKEFKKSDCAPVPGVKNKL